MGKEFLILDFGGFFFLICEYFAFVHIGLLTLLMLTLILAVNCFQGEKYKDSGIMTEYQAGLGFKRFITVSNGFSGFF